MYQTQAIILKKDPFGESNILVAAFTEKYGKIRFLAQSARKEGAKLKGHLEPGTLAFLGFVAGKNMYRLVEADTVAMFPSIAGSLKKIQAVWWIFDLVERNTMEDLRNEAGDFFSALVKFLRDCEDGQPSALPIRLLVLRAEFALYRYLGILSDSAPNLHEAHDKNLLAGAETLSRVIMEQELHSRRNFIIGIS